jgi:hypothetical protein
VEQAVQQLEMVAEIVEPELVVLVHKVEWFQVGQVLVHKVEWVDLTNTFHLIIMDTMDTTDTTYGWVIPGIGGANMVIGGAGTTVALAGGGMSGMVIHIGGGTEIIGEAGYPAGAPTLIRTDPPPLSFYFLWTSLVVFRYMTEGTRWRLHAQPVLKPFFRNRLTCITFKSINRRASTAGVYKRRKIRSRHKHMLSAICPSV